MKIIQLEKRHSKKIVEEIFLKKERQTDNTDRQRQLAIVKEVLTRRAGVAQSVEQLIRNYLINHL